MALTDESHHAWRELVSFLFGLSGSELYGLP